MSFVLDGSLEAYISDLPGGSNVLLKLIRSGGCLTPTLYTLSLLLQVSRAETTDTSLGEHPRVESYTFRAAENTKIAVLSVAAFKQIIKDSPDTVLRLVDAALRRLYFVTFPFASTYLGMEQETLDYGKSIGTVRRNGNQSWLDFETSITALRRIRYQELFTPAPADDERLAADLDSTYAPLRMKDDVGIPGDTARWNGSTFKAATSTQKKLHVVIPSQQEFTTLQKTADPPLASVLSQVEENLFLSSSKALPAATYSRAIKETISQLMLEAILSESPLSIPSDRSTSGTLHDVFNSAIELCFLPKGSILARRGQRLAGMYLLVDGTLALKIATYEETEPPPRVAPSRYMRQCSNIS